jgi:serine/threonine protein kinase
VAASEPHADGLAAAILDGTPIDWGAAEVSAQPEERSLLREFRLLAAVADLYRNPAAITLDSPSGARHPDVPRRAIEAPPHWGTLRVLERIGHGAFGDVYRAWDPRLDREVALKLLPASDSDSVGTSIIEEGRLLARVRHPNVVTIYGAERIEGRVGLWMELVRGRTLQQLVDERQPLTAAETARIGAELVDAVGAVHAAGLLHRDIKPSNVMLAEDGRVVLMDFGTGRELEETAGGGLAGTPLYLAPEVLAGGQATVRSDIYSLGVVLYHMLTGSFPVRAASLRELQAARENSAPTPLRARRPDLPKGQTRVIERAIHRDPATRYESAAALARDLRAVVPLPLRTKVVRGGIAAALLAALAVPVATGLFLKRHPVLRPSPPRELTRLTFGPGLQTDVAWSADGQQIAYASNWAGSMDIWVQPVSGGEPTRLTASREADTQPAWSPDGTSIAFRSERDGGGLFVISLESGTTRKLTSFGYLPAWSPDGRTVSFYKGVPSGISNRAFVVPADGSQPPWPILEDFLKDGMWRWLAPHPDGRMSAVGTHRTHGLGFFTIELDGTGLTISRVPPELSATFGFNVPRRSLRFHWSSSGSTLYLEAISPEAVSDAAPNIWNALPNVWMVRAVGDAIDWRTAERLTTGAARAVMAAVSPDGRRLAFTSDRAVRRAWVYPFDSLTGTLTGEGRPVTSEDVEVGDVVMSADGRALLYDTAIPGGRTVETFRIDLETGDTHMVGRNHRAGAYSRDGTRVSYMRYREKRAGNRQGSAVSDGYEFMLVARELGGPERLLSPWMRSAFLPLSWTSDGQTLLGSYWPSDTPGSAALALWPASTPVREKPERVLLESRDHEFWQSTFSPDESWISFVIQARDNPARAGIGIIPASGAPPGGWTPVAADHDWADKPRWAPDGRALYFRVTKVHGVLPSLGRAHRAGDGPAGRRALSDHALRLARIHDRPGNGPQHGGRQRGASRADHAECHRQHLDVGRSGRPVTPSH